MIIFPRVVASLLAGVAMLAATSAGHAANIVEIAASNKNFSTLVTAVKAAGLADDLASGKITVFAPTNAAFAKLPKKTLASLLKPENKKQLRAILTYHVVPGKIYAKDIPHKPTRVATLNGSKVRAVRQGKRVAINSAHVTKANIKADNGVIHVIDTVLIPGKH